MPRHDRDFSSNRRGGRGGRDRDFGDRDYGGGSRDFGGGGYQSRDAGFTPRDNRADEPGKTVNATVKWFNATKGFGFVSPDDGSQDAFLHTSVLRLAGHSELPEGSEITAVIGRGQKGPEVREIVSVIKLGSGTTPGRATRGGFSRTQQESAEADGSIKWFNATKGFGFIMPDAGGKDVFFHATVLDKAGLSAAMMTEGLRVRFRTTSSPKGDMVSSLEVA